MNKKPETFGTETFSDTVKRFGSVVEAQESRYDIALFCTPGELKAKPYIARGRSVIQIDTLRNSTCITVALASGAKDIVLYGKREDSLKQLEIDAQLYPELKLKAGEVEGQPIPSFDCGNSPLEFPPQKVLGRRIFYSSTNNGSALRLLLDQAEAGQVFWACMLNATTIGAAIRGGDISLPLLFLCAGFRGTMALEDMICAGQILLSARWQTLKPEITLDDGATLAVHEAERYFDAGGEICNPEQLCDKMKATRCGSVLALLKQTRDIEATVYGKGIDPEILPVVRTCVPRLDCLSIPHKIYKWIPPTTINPPTPNPR